VTVETKEYAMRNGDRDKIRIRTLIDGELAHVDVDALELESARRALRLLRERIPPEQMDALLARDLDESDERWRCWASRSDGSWKAAEVEFQVHGLSKEEFQDWWGTAREDLHGVMYPGFPEHYRFGWVPDPRGVDEPCLMIVEELGYVPFRMYCSFDPDWAPVAVTPGYEPISEGVGRLRDGTEVVRFMNQLKNIDDGFSMKVGVYMVSAVPQSVVDSHVDQELVEWTRWIQMAHASAHPV
jgi:hypothetical protein